MAEKAEDLRARIEEEAAAEAAAGGLIRPGSMVNMTAPRRKSALNSLIGGKKKSLANMDQIKNELDGDGSEDGGSMA